MSRGKESIVVTNTTTYTLKHFRITHEPKSQRTPEVYQRSYWLLQGARFVCVALLLASYIYSSNVQLWLNELWQYALSSRIYNSVYFETLFTTFCYGVIIAVYPFTVHYISSLDKYKVDPSVTYEHQTVAGLVQKTVLYITPLATLDTFIVKKYVDVQPHIWEVKRKDWIQITRALPLNPPTFIEVVFDLTASVLLFDFIFFFLHLALHKNIWLYKMFHRCHHTHSVLHPHVTDQLSVGERLALILSANFALKCFNSHPLTRTFFVPVFVFLLIENHTGYDLPLGIHRIIPFGILPGPEKHYNHHMNGERNYQPFLNYMDFLYMKVKNQRRENLKK